MTTISQHIGNASLSIEATPGADQIQVTTTIDGTTNSNTVNITWQDLLNAEACRNARDLSDLLGVPVALDSDRSAQVAKNLAGLDGDQMGVDIYSCMALFQKIAQSMRNTARVQRDTEMQAQVSALNSAADKMRDAAQKRFDAAMIQGSMQIVGGAIQAGTAMYSANKSFEAARLEAKSTTLSEAVKHSPDNALSPDVSAEFSRYAADDKAQAQVLAAQGQRAKDAGQGMGGILTGAGTIASGHLERSAALDEADKARLETEAKVHETAVQHSNDMMQQMMDVIRDVREKLQSIQQAAVETNRGIARNI